MTLEALRDGDPRQVGPYALLGRLGEGGMGVVYLGRGSDGVRVAVKLIHARMDADADFRRRFAREVDAAKRVARFCTAPVLDADVQSEVAYLVTEYVEGPSLGDAVRESGPLKGSALEGLAAAMAMALRAIHGAGVVHRDLKPSNVLLSQVGPKVIDFGIAQLTDAEASSSIVGTPSYMSPEQVSGATIGPASDIFSWGCTVAFAAGGVPPFGTGSVPTILLRIVNEPPDLRGLSGTLQELVVAALAKNPAERPTAQNLMDRLSTATGLLPTPGLSAPSPASPGAGAQDTPGPASGEGMAGGRPPNTAGPGATDPGMAGTGATEPGAAGPKQAFGQRRLLAGAAAVVVAVAGASAALMLRDKSTSETTPPKATGAQNTQNTPAANDTTPQRGQNPLTAQESVRFYSRPEPNARNQAVVWEKEGRKGDAALMDKLANVPHVIRLDESGGQAEVEETLADAKEAGGVPVFLINVMPGGDCQPLKDGAMATYQGWLRGIAGKIGKAPAVIILEPSSLVKLPGSKDCTTLPGTPDQRFKDVADAVRTLKANPNTAVYLDGAQDLYPGTEIMAERLIKAGIDKADGFFINTASYQRTARAVEYGKKLSACVSVQRATGKNTCPLDAEVDTATMPHFVVDTARNGQGSWRPDKTYKDPQTWCNPPGRGVGDRPTTDTKEELVDAYLWIARAGTSSGRCRRGTGGDKDPEYGKVAPQAGEWWSEMALERAVNANPALQ
ncbi:glycoside hydrolase family 6 protein [Nonomuraea sp. NPDC046802]|uniref:glycoside hydrolase family 6 protein n=1 Tax=Nonomuraea sp. NPDC046802 TaxID=3154919 RepID=UPI0033C7215A